MTDKIKKVAALWQEAKNVVILSGAGMSTASGLPDFRSKTGLWRQRPEALATLIAMNKTPDDFYFFYQWRIARLWQTQPNPGHTMLANMEKKGKVKLIVTQNVDSLHQRAGSKKVDELHGSLRTVSCLKCAMVYDSKIIIPQTPGWDEEPAATDYHHGKECYCTNCGGQLRPDVVLFGEQLPMRNWQQAVTAAKEANLIIVLGSSLVVGPANQLPNYTLGHGGKLVIINYDRTQLDSIATVVINDDIPKVLNKVEEAFLKTK